MGVKPKQTLSLLFETLIKEKLSIYSCQILINLYILRRSVVQNSV